MFECKGMVLKRGMEVRHRGMASIAGIGEDAEVRQPIPLHHPRLFPDEGDRRFTGHIGVDEEPAERDKGDGYAGEVDR